MKAKARLVSFFNRRRTVSLVAAGVLTAGVVGVVPALADTAPQISFPGGEPSITAITETSVHLHAEVNPGSGPSQTSWEFQYSSSGQSGPFTPVAGGSGTLPADETFHAVEADLEGLTPSTRYWVRVVAENEGGGNETISQVNDFETLGPANVETFAVHAFHEGKIRVMGSIEPQGFETHYHFEFGQTTAYDAPGSPTPTVDLPAGSGFNSTRIVGADLEGLEPGATYHFRLVATSEAAGHPTSTGEDRTFVAPTPGPAGEPACSNTDFRTGPSSRLPDCRAYEQVTPENKGAAMDVFGYGALTSSGGAAEDGNAFFMRAPTKWGPSPDAVQSWYVFDRNGTHAWDMKSVTPQPEGAGIHYESQIFNGDLSQTALATREEPTLGSPGPDSILRLGPIGGPYATAAEVAFSEEGFGEGGSKWVGASQDFSRVFLQSREHELDGTPSGTAENRKDLYEYSGGQFHQLNQINGETIGTCGAAIAAGYQTYDSGYQTTASPHAVSQDGSRVIFMAQPTGTNCFFGTSSPTEESRLYLSVDGVPKEIAGGGTSFLGANEALTRILVQKNSDVYLYDSETEDSTLIAEDLFFFNSSVSVSLEANAMYFTTGQRLTPEAPGLSPDTETQNKFGGAFGGPQNLYRLDVATKQLQFITQTGPPGPRPNLQYGGGKSVSRNGQYYYWSALSPTGGLPAGDPETTQVYRYDNTDGSIQCVACSSSFNFEPKYNNTYLPQGTPASFLAAEVANGLPNVQVASDNGDFVFFDSPSELVPQDVDGEVEPEVGPEADYDFSPSSDVYEWRRNGVNGCTEVQGCLRLISSGRGGSKVMLLGTNRTGNDVFFATHEKLVGQDTDDLGDVYDARVNGGYPGPPAPPAGCEGSSCSTPVPPPNDVTPGSMTTHKVGNVHKKRVKPCPKKKVRKHGKCVLRHKHKKKSGHNKKKGAHRKHAHRRADSNRGGQK